MILSIHQPNFFPWYPFFQKIEQSDCFVLLGHCQFEKNNYQNRFHINEKWMTLSVNSGLDDIINKKYVNYEKDWRSIKDKIPKYKKILENFDDCMGENLYETNFNIIERTCNILEIKTKLLKDFSTNNKSDDRLIEICEYYNSNCYLSGPTGKDYMNIEKFNNKNINVIFQNTENTIKKPILEVLYEKL